MPNASDTFLLQTTPLWTFTPLKSALSLSIAFLNPKFASFMTYGRVALARAKVEVRGTAPGIFATP